MRTVYKRQTGTRRLVLWAVVMLVAVAIFAAVVRSNTSDNKVDNSVVKMQIAKTVVLVEDAKGFCDDLQHLTMSKRISTPSLYSRIMPSEVPDEHFANEAQVIAQTIPVDFSKAVKKAADYDEAVQKKCQQGGN